MADNVPVTPGSGETIATKDEAGIHHQRVLIETIVGGAPADVSSDAPIPVSSTNPAIGDTTDAAASGNGSVIAILKKIRDLLPTSLTGGGALKVSVQDAIPAGSNAIGDVGTELQTKDLDSGAGTDTHAVVGLVMAKSGGAVLAPGDDTNGYYMQSKDGAILTLGTTTDADATGNGSAIGLLKRLRTLLAGGLPAAFTSGGGVKVGLVDSIPAGTNAIGKLSANSGVTIGDVNLVSAIPAGTNSIGKLGANSGVTIGDVNAISVPSDPFGANSDAAIVTDTTGSMQGKLRGLVKWAFERMPASLGQKAMSASLPVVLASDQAAVPVIAELATGTIMSGTTALTPKFAKANVAASATDSSIVAAVGGKKIRVLEFRLHAGGTATNVTFNTKPAGAGSAISELFACAANGGRGEGFSPVGHFETNSGEGLTVTTGAGSTTGIGVVYVEA